jgi:hypothetical protein
MTIKDKFLKFAIIVFLVWLFGFLWMNSMKYEIYRDGFVCVRINKITGKISWAKVGGEAKWHTGKQDPKSNPK